MLLDGAIKATSRVGLMLNVRKDDLEKVIAALPALRNPTISQLSDAGWLAIELPPWLLAASYALVGWSTGLGFNRTILHHAAQALPRVVMSILVLMAVCGGLSALLVVAAGIDPLTAYLATSPGGADSAAIIAMASHVDVAFVMAMQTTRLVLVLLIGPSLASFVARRAGARKSAE